MPEKPTDILILGGGFAGVRAAHVLGRQRRRLNLEVSLLDRETHHVNTPILYEVASAFVPWEREGVGKVMRGASGVPFRTILEGWV